MPRHGTCSMTIGRDAGAWFVLEGRDSRSTDVVCGPGAGFMIA